MPGRRRVATLSILLGVVVGAAGCSQRAPVARSANQWGPQLEGTITAIQPGAATRVTLAHIQQALRTDGPFHQYAAMTVTIGPGRWVAPHHWQGSHDAMDLFVGEAIAAVPQHIARTLAGQPTGCLGVIRRIQGDLVTVQITNYIGDNRTGHSIYRLTPTFTTFHIAPYSQFSWEGNPKPPFSASQLKVGQYVDGTWEGAQAYRVADQWTIFPTVSAFDGGILEPVSGASLTPQPTQQTSTSRRSPQPSDPSPTP